MLSGWCCEGLKPTPLKNLSESQLGLLFPTEWNNSQNVPKHQPAMS